MNDALRTELLVIMERDERVRAELVASGELFDGYHPRMAAVHEENADKLEAIIAKHGWPGKSLVGEEGTEAAWLILQHAIGRPRLLRNCLPLLRAAADKTEIPAWQVACLEDRICVFEGHPQRFGTQFDWDGTGQLNPCPLQDPERVDDYRKSVGLGPLGERLEEVRRRAAAENHQQPRDFEKRQREAEAWAKSTGWR